LSSCLGNKDAAQKILEDLNIPINKRPEEILPKQYVEIYNLSKDYLIDIH
jgi:16S rRNA A1518/A1519 N6-dimethyltransferase RsmA/KsgA/DIM1 with predicted DNA glycosylase/AP lyase activity